MTGVSNGMATCFFFFWMLGGCWCPLLLSCCCDFNDDDRRSFCFILLRNNSAAETSVLTSELLLLLAALFLRFKFCWAADDDERRIAEPATAADETEGVVDLVDGRLPPPPLMDIDMVVAPEADDVRRRPAAKDECCACPVVIPGTTARVAVSILSSCSLASVSVVCWALDDFIVAMTTRPNANKGWQQTWWWWIAPARKSLYKTQESRWNRSEADQVRRITTTGGRKEPTDCVVLSNCAPVSISPPISARCICTQHVQRYIYI